MLGRQYEFTDISELCNSREPLLWEDFESPIYRRCKRLLQYFWVSLCSTHRCQFKDFPNMEALFSPVGTQCL